MKIIPETTPSVLKPYSPTRFDARQAVINAALFLGLTEDSSTLMSSAVVGDDGRVVPSAPTYLQGLDARRPAYMAELDAKIAANHAAERAARR